MSKANIQRNQLNKYLNFITLFLKFLKIRNIINAIYLKRNKIKRLGFANSQNLLNSFIIKIMHK
jgi:hypothetical protein